ncbi:hypothetical protein HPB52_001233 [Rhipicephalus sanguineus]|uniref:Uncharacterized protein n=1 Tax=Rhipicephalus sanguineus TaxID=34632 RepID=A0A9D4Q475_RHISA|nr:hypothetical protein HPB52_001233 [Rhipicephalus sanguineus]
MSDIADRDDCATEDDGEQPLTLLGSCARPRADDLASTGTTPGRPRSESGGLTVPSSTSLATTTTERRDSSLPRTPEEAAPRPPPRRSGCWPKSERGDDGERYSQPSDSQPQSRPRTPPSSSGREEDDASPGPGAERASSSPRGSVAWVAALMNHRFVRSFSERLVGGKRARAECWWRKLRAQRLTAIHDFFSAAPQFLASSTLQFVEEEFEQILKHTGTQIFLLYSRFVCPCAGALQDRFTFAN